MHVLLLLDSQINDAEGGVKMVICISKSNGDTGCIKILILFHKLISRRIPFQFFLTLTACF